jgi:salicylate hydroxylase
MYNVPINAVRGLTKAQIGAGIQIPPNSSRILHSWGLEDALNKKAVKPAGVCWRRWQNGEMIGNARFNPDFEERYGAPYYVIHRAHFHEVLHDRAVELGVPVELNWRVVQYDLEAGSLTRKDGSTIHADLIVAADGKQLSPHTDSTLTNSLRYSISR